MYAFICRIFENLSHRTISSAVCAAQLNVVIEWSSFHFIVHLACIRALNCELADNIILHQPLLSSLLASRAAHSSPELNTNSLSNFRWWNVLPYPFTSLPLPISVHHPPQHCCFCSNCYHADGAEWRWFSLLLRALRVYSFQTVLYTSARKLLPIFIRHRPIALATCEGVTLWAFATQRPE